VGALSVLSVQYETVRAGFDVPISYDGSLSRSSKPILLLVAEPVAVYRPRDPEQTAFYQLFDKHFDDYVYGYEERFEAKAGPLREVVRPTVEAFEDCGRLFGGFARIRCPSCRSEHLLAFSCQTRNFCPSCQAKRPGQLGTPDQKSLEVDPLLCGKCGSEMKIVAVVTDPKVVDRIIRHLDKNAVTPRSPPPMSAQLNPTLPSHDNL
jgi:hypothetical protein